MREKYTRFFDNDTTTAIGCGVAIVMLFISVLAGVATRSTAGAGLAFMLIVIIMVAFNITEPKASFDADDTQVTFSYLGRKTVIRYGEIKDMKIERRNNEFKTRSGIQRCYVETLTITTTDKTYEFKAQMDIDYDKIAMNPTDLTVQFENSKFSKLKTYIEEHIPIMQID